MSFEITEQIQQIDEVLGRLKDEIEYLFAETDDLDYGRFLIAQADHVEELRKALGHIETSFDHILEEMRYSPASTATRGEKGLRRIEIEVTDGMRNQSILALTRARKAGIVKVGEEMEIELPSGERFKTKIVSPGNRLRERGRVKEFYQSEGVESDDHVVLEEVEKGRWKLSLDKNRRITPEQIRRLLPFHEDKNPGDTTGENIIDRLSRREIGLARTQGEKLALILGGLVQLTPGGLQHVTRVTRTHGRCIMISTDRHLIEKTCQSPDIHEVKLDEKGGFFINITTDLDGKKALVDKVARSMGYPAHVRSELKALMDYDGLKDVINSLVKDSHSSSKIGQNETAKRT